MGLENFEIHLDSPTASYSSGQTITGKIDLNFNSVKTLQGIEVKLKGEANVKWSENQSVTVNDRTEIRTRHYSGNEEYLNTKFFIIGGLNTDSIQLEPGSHVYPLSFTLPSILPSSFEGDLGHVRYALKVTLIRPWEFDQSLKVAFTVIDKEDTNSEPKWREPATLTMETSFCYGFCKSGPLTGVLKLPCTGFVSGQTIPMILEIDNASEILVTHIEINLKKIDSYRVQLPYTQTKHRNDVVVQMKIAREVKPNSSATFNENMLIPALPPSNIKNCNIINLKYELRIIVVVEGMRNDMLGNIPITIGTIPFDNMAPMPRPQLSVLLNAASQSLLGWIPSSSNVPPIVPNLMPAPSNEQCEFGAQTILEEGESEHTRYKANLAPPYPAYNYKMVPSNLTTPPGGSSAPSTSSKE